MLKNVLELMLVLIHYMYFRISGVGGGLGWVLHPVSLCVKGPCWGWGSQSASPHLAHIAPTTHPPPKVEKGLTVNKTISIRSSNTKRPVLVVKAVVEKNAKKWADRE